MASNIEMGEYYKITEQELRDEIRTIYSHQQTLNKAVGKILERLRIQLYELKRKEKENG